MSNRYLEPMTNRPINGIALQKLGGGSFYEGAFKEGQFHGVGSLHLASGAQFSGSYFKGKASGLGHFEFGHDTHLFGNFVEGSLEGICFLKQGDKSPLKFYAKNGKTSTIESIREILCENSPDPTEFIKMEDIGTLLFNRTACSRKAIENCFNCQLICKKIKQNKLIIAKDMVVNDISEEQRIVDIAEKSKIIPIVELDKDFSVSILMPSTLSYYELKPSGEKFEGKLVPPVSLKRRVGIIMDPTNPNSVYEGEMIGKKKSGNGKMYDAGRLIYVGHFRKNLRHGRGVEYQEDCSMSGTWDMGKKHGIFIIHTTGDVAMRYYDQGMVKDETSIGMFDNMRQINHAITSSVFGDSGNKEGFQAIGPAHNDSSSIQDQIDDDKIRREKELQQETQQPGLQIEEVKRSRSGQGSLKKLKVVRQDILESEKK